MNNPNFPNENYKKEKKIFENMGNLKKMVFESNETDTSIKIFYICRENIFDHSITCDSKKSLEKSCFRFLEELTKDLNGYGNPQDRKIQAQFVAWCEVYKILRKYIFENFPTLINQNTQAIFELKTETILNYYRLKNRI